MTTIRVCKSFRFSAAHYLGNVELGIEEQEELFGKCCGIRRDPSSGEVTVEDFPHGHTYRLDVVIEGKIKPETGMIINFVDIKRAVTELVLDYYDHKFLNKEVTPYCSNNVIPTAENMAHWIFAELCGVWNGKNKPKLVSVRLWEGPESWAEVCA